MFIFLCIQEAYYKQLYESEVSGHRTTRTSLEKAKQQIADLQAQLAQVILEQEQKLKKAQEEVNELHTQPNSCTSSTDDMLLFLQMLSFFLALHNIFQVLSFEQVKVVLK